MWSGGVKQTERYKRNGYCESLQERTNIRLIEVKPLIERADPPALTGGGYSLDLGLKKRTHQRSEGRTAAKRIPR